MIEHKSEDQYIPNRKRNATVYPFYQIDIQVSLQFQFKPFNHYNDISR